MHKKVYKLFINFLEGQENWLNEMSLKGYRLIKAGRYYYEFEQCEPEKYKYIVEFVMDKTNKELKEYCSFLSELGINSFKKNVNIGKYSFGEVKIRPYFKGKGSIATNPGKINSELLILEKKNDGQPFKIHSSVKEIIEYFKNIRNTFLFTDLFITVFFILMQCSIKSINISMIAIKLLLILLILFLTIDVFKYTKLIKYYKEKENLYE